MTVIKNVPAGGLSGVRGGILQIADCEGYGASGPLKEETQTDAEGPGA
ncbi:MAG: hypothetical protein ACREBU_08640 [Nitrososphaera sp.]